MPFQFLRTNASWLAVPTILTFASGFGQTFYITIFGAPLRDAFSLSHGDWGGLYMIGTLLAAAAMMAFGSVADRQSPKWIVSILFPVFAICALAMALNPFWWLLPIIVFGIRFCGQGMSMHLSQVMVSRDFAVNRGKAMSYAMAGIVFAEAFLPMVFVRIQNAWDWRMAWGIAALSIAVLGVVVHISIPKRSREQSVVGAEKQYGMTHRSWTRREMVHDWVFWFALPSSIMMPFLGTIFFFQMPVFVASKNWDLADFTAQLPFYAVMAYGALLFMGVMLDRLGSRRLMAWVCWPLGISYLMMSFAVTPFQGFWAFMLMGFGQGVASAYIAVFWVDYYGTQHIGSIRALIASVTVFAAAIGPWISGWLLDHGVSFETLLTLMFAYASLAALMAALVAWGTRERFSNLE